MQPRPDRSPERSANIFISYRQEDSAGHSGRLFDVLGDRFPDRLFMDVDTLEPGVDFVDAIKKAVGSCEVLIVVIGQKWLTVADAAGQRRLDDPGDFVRQEVESALGRDIRVIPVLVQGAAMPQADELPSSLARLARRNAIGLSDTRWAYDVDRLVKTIREALGEEAPAPEPRQEEPPPAPAARAARPGWMLKLAAAFLVGAVVLVSAGWVRAKVDSGPLPIQKVESAGSGTAQPTAGETTAKTSAPPQVKPTTDGDRQVRSQAKEESRSVMDRLRNAGRKAGDGIKDRWQQHRSNSKR